MPGVICVLLIIAFAVGIIFMCYVLNVRGHTHCSEVVHFSTLCARFPHAGQSFKPCLCHWFPQKLHVLLLLFVCLLLGAC